MSFDIDDVTVLNAGSFVAYVLRNPLERYALSTGCPTKSRSIINITVIV
jgi:hypothetical protein